MNFMNKRFLSRSAKVLLTSAGLALLLFSIGSVPLALATVNYPPPFPTSTPTPTPTPSPTPEPDPTSLVISKSAPANVQGGDVITYTVTVLNVGATEAVHVQIADTIPEHTKFLSVNRKCRLSSGGSTTQLVCNIGDLDPGRTRSFQFKVRTIIPQACGKVISNMADAGAQNAPATWSNTAKTTVSCPAPTPTATPTPSPTPTATPTPTPTPTPDPTSLVISKSAPANVQGGDVITYTVTVLNVGGSKAENVHVAELALQSESAKVLGWLLALALGN